MTSPEIEEMVEFVEIDGVGVALIKSEKGLILTVSGSTEFVRHLPLTALTTNKPSPEIEEIVEHLRVEFDVVDSPGLREYITTLPTKHQEEIEKAVEAKNNAYHERDMLVCALSKVFPSYLARHDESDTSWEDDWRWIVYINLPSGKMLLPTGNEIEQSTQVSWHIHDSERDMFSHLEVKENNWDGHNTERKYQRLNALQALTPTKTDKQEGYFCSVCGDRGHTEDEHDYKGIKTDKQTEV